MTFNTLEISNKDGKPVALYEFNQGNTYWRYTTNDEDLTIGLNTWVAEVISDEGVTQGGSSQNDLQIVLASDLDIPGLFRFGQPSGKVWLRVRRYHLGDPDSETPIQWVGTVVNSKLESLASSRLHCISIGGTFDRDGLRLGWERNCPHVLYGNGCNQDGSNEASAHAYSRTIETVDGNHFSCTTHSEPTEGSFSGGFVEWDREDGSQERRFIEKQTANDFLVMGSMEGIEVGLAVTLYPGCDRTTTICNLFANMDNFGGLPHLPSRSPFDGNPVF